MLLSVRRWRRAFTEISEITRITEITEVRMREDTEGHEYCCGGKEAGCAICAAQRASRKRVRGSGDTRNMY